MSILNLLPLKQTKAKHLVLPSTTMIQLSQPGTPEILQLSSADATDRYLAATRILDHAEADQKAVKESLTEPVRELYFRSNAGLASPMKSVQLVGNQGSVLVSFNALWNPSAETLPLPPDMLREQFTIKVKSEDIPPEKQESFVKALLALAAQHGVSDAISATAKRVPVPAFADLRHRSLTPEQNIALENEGLGTRMSWRVQ